MSFLYYFKDLFKALILRPLIRDPFRTAITIIGVAVGVAVFLSIRLANQQTMMSFTESVDLVLGRADAVIRAEGMDFDETHFAKLHVLRNEIKAYPVIEGYGQRIIELMERAATDFNTTVILVTHNPKIAECGNKHYEIRDGKLNGIQ